jgi:hypothetical protein
MRPGKERQYSAGGSRIIPEVEVVSPWIVEVYGLLDEAQAKHIGIEIQIALWIARYGGHMMQADDRFGWHRINSFGTVRFDIEVKDSESAFVYQKNLSRASTPKHL